MKNLNQIKTAAQNSGQSEAKVVLAHVRALEEEGADDDLMRSSLQELAEWALAFKDSIGAT